jgi:hypothetical protein
LQPTVSPLQAATKGGQMRAMVSLI